MIRGVLIFALGAFALVAQTLLFRDFFSVFEGNELGVGVFFASWLAWIAVGALAARANFALNRLAAKQFPLVSIICVPAFMVQLALVARARALAGVEAYELFPFAPMFAMTFLVNAPVSVLTGFFFTTACRWAEERYTIPAARVYILETLGSCVGAVGATALLALGYPGEAVFILASGVLGAAAVGAALPRERAKLAGLLALLPVVAALGAVLAGIPVRWADVHGRERWQQLLPGEAYRGQFTTPQARYLYGVRDEQFIVMSGGGVCETLPAEDHAAEVAAIHLAQKPAAKRVLVFGEGALGVCSKLRAFPHIEHVAWMHPDPAYPKALSGIIREGFIDLCGPAPDEVIDEDLRQYARTSPERYDLIILQLPDITNLVLNRYCTTEFFAVAKGLLAEGGILSVRISGGANFMGDELALLGASMVATIEGCFTYVAIKPGEETWLLASDGEGLTQSPAVLRDRFSKIAGAAGVYPPEGLAAIYEPNRVVYQLRVYDDVATRGAAFMSNTDARPSALVFSLLVALKQAGWRQLIRQVFVLAGAGWMPFILPILLYTFLRWAYLWAGRRGKQNGRHLDARFLVFSAGFAGMAVSVILLFHYQVRHGSLFLHVGLLTALFMFGAFLGGRWSEWLVTRFPAPAGSGRPENNGTSLRYLLAAFILIHVALALLLDTALGGTSLGAALDTCAFLLCGMFTGVYFPIAARWLEMKGARAAATGSALEMADHLGGAAGALLVSLIMVPILGSGITLNLIALLMACNLVPLLVRGASSAPRGDAFDRLARPAGYLLFATGILLIAETHIWKTAQAAEQGRKLIPVAQELTAVSPEDSEKLLHERPVVLPGGGNAAYVEVDEGQGVKGGYVFETRTWAPDISGYGGPIKLAVYVDAGGVLLDYLMLESYETPMYLDMLADWQKEVVGHNLFEPSPFKGVDVVSGATISSEAILWGLEEAGRAFAVYGLGRAPNEEGASSLSAGLTWNKGMRDLTVLLAFVGAAVVLRLYPSKWLRRGFLVVVAGGLGFWLNLQFSSWHVMTLLTVGPGGVSLSGAYFLLVGIPLVAALFGNIYCGHICPFGALQELAGEIMPLEPWLRPAKRVWRYTRGLKYIVLLVLVGLFFVAGSPGVLDVDPLTSIFSENRSLLITVVAVLGVTLSVVFPRFWCRNLCPAGAFLSLMGGLRLLSRVPLVRRLVPPRYPGRCDLGVRSQRDLDCLYCDRCAMRGAERVPDKRDTHMGDWIFLAVALAAFVALVGLVGSEVMGQRGGEALPVQADAAVPEEAPRAEPPASTAGQPRNVDAAKIRQQIERGDLSGQEAQFYSPVK